MSVMLATVWLENARAVALQTVAVIHSKVTRRVGFVPGVSYPFLVPGVSDNIIMAEWRGVYTTEAPR